MLNRVSQCQSKDGQTDRRTTDRWMDRQTDRQTDRMIPIYPPELHSRGVLLKLEC